MIDDFTGSNGDPPNAALWSPTNIASSNMAIQNNELYWSASGAADQWAYTTSLFEISGDFDIQVDWENLSRTLPSSSTSYLAMLMLINTNDATEMRVSNIIFNTGHRYTVLEPGQSDVAVDTTEYSGKFRFTRVGTVIKAFYWSGAQWGWDGNTAGLTLVATWSYPVTMSLRASADFDGATETQFDKVSVESDGITGTGIVGHPETNIVSSISSDLQIQLVHPGASIPIVVADSIIFTGVFVPTPEISIPIITDASNISIDIVPAEAIIHATVTSNISIIIVPAEAIIPAVVTSNIFNINIASNEILIPVDASGSTVTTFSMASTVLRYLLTITGSADGTTDFELPMSSFQARRKSGEATYLSVVIPTMDYASQIAARSNGTIKVEQAYTLDGEYVQRELILEAEINNIQTYQGGRNQSVVLDGYKTTTYTAKSITLTTATYKALSGGKLRYRVAKPNVFLNPGDTVTIDSDTFIIGTMSYAISPTMQQIELEEA